MDGDALRLAVYLEQFSKTAKPDEVKAIKEYMKAISEDNKPPKLSRSNHKVLVRFLRGLQSLENSKN
jgi:hypothetical protein